MKGGRKLIMFGVAVGALCGGFGFSLFAKMTAAEVLFSTFATSLAGLLVAAMAGNVGEHVAKKDKPE